ncbi:hypothetical protein CROQUDRAFT_88455 [Cronartium quercuum f. sp. fusiforme G11]|uniref:Wax synthase domain-containing protein n=1 Tax=Cronartium quercuum f. sp. fusiforme G11 TaxID=708437 RepID=A0A9P6NPZ0_9BASI|nr:hypothetical protein CROQUDRAFT_88455 [Cronartium quercuum f. sp. fusiforme G11]
MALALSFTLAQLPLLGQAFFLHPHYRSTRNARYIRLGLIPLTLAMLASFSSQWLVRDALDSFTNIFVGSFIALSGLRSVIWGTASDPYYLLADPNPSSSVFDRLLFAISLQSSPRGIGWSFGVPAKPVDQTRFAFLLETLRRLAFNLPMLVCSVILIGVIDSSSSAPSLGLRHLIAFFIGIQVWTMLDTAGCLVRLFALAFNLDLSKHPFFLDAPIKASSLADFWSRRWHSLAKHVFVEAGARPAQAIARFFAGEGQFSRASGILGAFLISGLLHEFCLWFATWPDYTFRTTLFFTAQGLGVVLEAVFRRATGLRVDGWLGRVWMLGWLVCWGRLMIDAWMEQNVVDKEAVRAYFLERGYL